MVEKPKGILIQFRLNVDEEDMINFLKERLNTNTRTKIFRKCLKIVYVIEKGREK